MTNQNIDDGSVRALLFDKDGTLFEFEATWSSWAEGVLFDLAGGDEQRAASAGMGIGFDYFRRRFMPSSPVIAGTAETTFRLLCEQFVSRTETEVLRICEKRSRGLKQVEAVPLRPLLAGLRQAGYALGIATNDSELSAREHIADAEITEFFDFIAGFDSGFGIKPDTGMLEEFTERAGVDAKACVMVGDSTVDMAAGRSAGMLTVGVLTGYASREDLLPMADQVIDNVGELPGWLGMCSAVERDAVSE